MKPAFGSEFSDRYVMTINTLLAYLVSGLNQEQVKQWLELYRNKAKAQKAALTEEGILCSVQDAPVCKIFEKATGLEIFKLDSENPNDIVAVQEALMQIKPEAIELLLEYVVDNEIGQVELYENQVCSNGQNTASMSHFSFFYSGSMDDNMAPLGSVAHPEKGTNGQTVDLVNRKAEVRVVENNVNSLLTMMKTHPLSKRIHAIIDVGAHFRGYRNEEAAKLICAYLTESRSHIQGVLFFDDNGDLCFMQRDYPDAIKRLSGTSAIETETGFNMKQLFTYYDQEHITGVDITQDEEAIAVVTLGEQTEIDEFLQGDRRMRGLDDLQGIILAPNQSAAQRIRETLHLDKKALLSSKDLCLYSYFKMVGGQKNKNMLYCLQKMENLVQQHILDKLYMMDVESERRLFSQCSYLFEKSVAIDLYKEYAYKRKIISMKTYLTSIKNSLLNPLEGVLSSREIYILEDMIENELLNVHKIDEMNPTLTVSQSFDDKQKEIAQINQNRETSRVQFRQQERKSEKIQLTEQTNLNEFLNEVEKRRIKDSSPKREEWINFLEFFEKNIGTLREVSNENKIWGLSDALKKERESHACQFDEGLMTTCNAAVTMHNRIDLTGPFRKKPWPLLVICDKDSYGNETWKVILCSITDARFILGELSPYLKSGLLLRNFFSSLKKYANKIDFSKISENREMWLARGNGKLIVGPSELEIDHHPQLSRLMTQVLFFSGEFETLSYKPWKARLEAWMGSMEENERTEWIRFFEEDILMGPYPGYSSSPLYRYFHPK